MHTQPSRSSPQNPLTYPKQSPHRATSSAGSRSADASTGKWGSGLKGCTVTPKGRPVLSFCAAFSGTLRDVSLRQRSRPASSEPPVLDMLWLTNLTLLGVIWRYQTPPHRCVHEVQ